MDACFEPSSANTASFSDISGRVIAAVVERTEHDLITLPPLYEYIDADALEHLYDHAGKSDVWVEFEYVDYTIVIDDGGTVEVHP